MAAGGPAKGWPHTFLIGAGPVAIALAGALRVGGVSVLGLWARRPDAARRAADSAGVPGFSGPFPERLGEADAVILAVRDEAIADVADAILSASIFLSRRPVFVHCSGARPAAQALGSIAERRGRAISGMATLHPLRALADGAQGITALPGTVFGIEGDEPGVAVARALAVAIGGVPLVLESEQMAGYHAAASMASNFLVALLDAAGAVLAGVGMDPDEALRALVPLARGSLENVAARGARAGLTGPIQRGDVGTVERHLASLRDRPELLTLYRAMARHTLRLARRPHQGDNEGDDEGDSEGDEERRARLDAIERLL